MKCVNDTKNIYCRNRKDMFLQQFFLYSLFYDVTTSEMICGLRSFLLLAACIRIFKSSIGMKMKNLAWSYLE